MVAAVLDSMSPVNKQMKGLLKGLRYISQIFEAEEKEQEMVIGNPTDVRHVAHIGCDGPSANNPSWMNGLNSSAASATGHDGKELGSSKPATQGNSLGGIASAPPRDEVNSPNPRRTRRHASSEAVGSDSPSRDGSASREARQSRNHHSIGSAPGSESPGRDGSDPIRRNRRHPSKLDSGAVGSGSEPPAGDLPSMPKQTRKKERKSKASDGGGSTRSRPKNPSLSEPGQEERIARSVMVEEAA